MAKNIELVRQEVAAMRNEVEDFANSAERVGGVVSDVLEYSHEESERAKGAEQGLSAAVAQNAGEIIALKGNSATKTELNAEAERAQAAEELISQQTEQNFRNFSDLGVEESAKMDGYEIALTKKTNTAEKTKVKVPVYDMQNPSATPVGLVDEIFVEDMKAEAKKMVDAEAERAQGAEELISQRAEQNFKNFSDLGVEESAKMDGYEIALIKKTNTAEKTKVKVPVYDMQNPSATPVGLVDEIFVEDMKAEAKEMVDAEAERAEAKEQEIEGKVAELESEVDDLVVDGKADFAICDGQGNNIVEFKEGGVATKKFDSSKTPSIAEQNDNDFAITDGSGNVLVSFSEGGIKTKKFDSLPRQLGSKKIGYIGDSITAGVENVPKDCCYPAVIARQMRWESVNYGIAGTGICTNYPSGANNNFISRIPSMEDDLDAVVVFGGTNDWGVGDGIPIGNMGDTTVATFYGGMYLLLKAIFNKYPNSKKLFLTPLRRNYTGSDAKRGSGDLQNAAGATLGEYVEAIKIMCARWSVPVLDMYEESGLPFDLSDNLVTIFTRGDGLHPNPFCHLSIIAPMIEIKLTKLFNII